jgi:hypothetical protein
MNHDDVVKEGRCNALSKCILLQALEVSPGEINTAVFYTQPFERIIRLHRTVRYRPDLRGGEASAMVSCQCERLQGNGTHIALCQSSISLHT